MEKHTKRRGPRLLVLPIQHDARLRKVRDVGGHHEEAKQQEPAVQKVTGAEEAKLRALGGHPEWKNAAEKWNMLRSARVIEDLRGCLRRLRRQ